MTPEQLSLLYEESDQWWLVREKIEKFLPYIASGHTRDVFLLPGGKHVLKYPIGPAGIKANIQEAELSKEFPDVIARSRMFGVSAIQIALNDVQFKRVENEDFDTEERLLLMRAKHIFQGKRRAWADGVFLQYGIDSRGRKRIYDINSY